MPVVAPPADENTPVQLARMEGVLNLVADRVSGLNTRVDRHESDIGNLKSRTQRLEDGAKASTEKAEALALALKEAKDAVDATSLQESQKAATAAREKSDKDALGWSPVTKVFAAATALAVIVNAYQALRPGA